MEQLRTKIMTEVVNHFNFKSYLEIGVRHKDSVFNKIPCEFKFCVDKDPAAQPDYCGTSDAFFEQKFERKWDVVFIDAWHIADQVYRDLMNSLSHLNEGGVIFLHDTLPTKYEFTYETGNCQTAWKVIPYVLKYHPELRACTLPDSSEGLGVVVKAKEKRTNLLEESFNPFYDYCRMDENRIKSQNIIQYKELFDWITNGK